MRNVHCPLEQAVERALKEAGIDYQTESAATLNLDFYLPAFDVYLEVKGGHTDRSAAQLARAHNVILVQGMKSVRFLVELLSKVGAPPEDAE